MASEEATPSHQSGMTPPSNNEAHAKLIAELQGQVMHVPNMLELFREWPCCGRNKYYKRLKARLDEIVESVYPDQRRRQRAAKNDFALFTSIWYPEADWERLYTCGIFSFWIFNCDDLMDENEESLSLDFAASCRFRQQILEYTRYWLGLDPVYPQTSTISKLHSWLLPSSRDENGRAHAFLPYLGLGPKLEPPCPNAACGIFKEFGQMVQRGQSKAFREMFYKELKYYFDHCEIEQEERLTGKISNDFESYLEIRRYTSAVRVYCFITQIALGTQIPGWILESPEMQALWKELNINIIIGNDILSAKKELSGGCIHNAVPIMYHRGRPLDAVTPELITELEACRDRFDEIAPRVQEMQNRASSKVRRDLLKYIDGLRTIATGTIEFCKIAERYGLEKYFNDDGTMDVVL